MEAPAIGGGWHTARPPNADGPGGIARWRRSYPPTNATVGGDPRRSILRSTEHRCVWIAFARMEFDLRPLATNLPLFPLESP